MTNTQFAIFLLVALVVIINQFLNNKTLFNLMTKQERLEAAVETINTATNEMAASITNIAEDLVTLKDQIASGTVPDDALTRLENSANALAGTSTALKELAAQTPNAGENSGEETGTEG